MDIRVSKWGNSLGLRIPKSVVDSAGLKPGSVVEVSASPDGFIARRKERKPEYSLQNLMAGVTPKNRHSAMDWGPPKGGEVW